MHRILLFLSLFLCSPALAVTPLIDCNGSNFLQSSSNPPKYACAVPPGSGGTVTTTGSPASGNLTKFSGATSITNGDLSGDVTTSSSLATTISKIQGVNVSGTSGTGNVVFSSAPTLSNPVVGTQTQGDNSTKAASTAYVDTATSGKLSTSLTSAHIFVGNGSNVATDTTLSGSGATFSLSNTGVLTISGIANASLSNSSVTISGHALSLGGSLSLSASDVGLGNVTNDTQTKSAIVPNTAPSAGQILVGNAGGTAYAPQTLSGSGATFSLSSSGVLTISAIPNASLSNSSITIAGHTVSLGGTQAIACGDLSNGASGCSTATGTSGAAIPLLNAANTWSGVQSITSGDLALKGATSGTLTLNAAATASGTLTLPAGTTDFSSTGGTSQVVKQTSLGGAFTVAQVAYSDLSGTIGGAGINSGTFANKPGSPSAKDLYYATDLGTGVLIEYTGSKWKPVAGSAVISASGTNTTTNATSEHNLTAVKIPQGLLSTNGIIRTTVAWVMTGSNNGRALILRHSTVSGATSGGTVEMSLTPSSTDTTLYSITGVWANNSTSSQKTFSSSIFGPVGTGSSATYTTSSIATASNDFYININANVNNSGDTAGYNMYMVEWIEP